jgi:hypothetical protein
MFTPSTAWLDVVRGLVFGPLPDSDPPRQPAIKVGNSKADRETLMGLFNMICKVSCSGIVELF